MAAKKVLSEKDPIKKEEYHNIFFAICDKYMIEKIKLPDDENITKLLSIEFAKGKWVKNNFEKLLRFMPWYLHSSSEQNQQEIDKSIERLNNDKYIKNTILAFAKFNETEMQDKIDSFPKTAKIKEIRMN